VRGQMPLDVYGKNAHGPEDDQQKSRPMSENGKQPERRYQGEYDRWHTKDMLPWAKQN